MAAAGRRLTTGTTAAVVGDAAGAAAACFSVAALVAASLFRGVRRCTQQSHGSRVIAVARMGRGGEQSEQTIEPSLVTKKMVQGDEKTQHPVRTESLVLVDGYACLYQAFHATKHVDLCNQSGEDYALAVQTFMRQVEKIRREWNPTHLAVMLDRHCGRSGTCMRSKALKEYKAGRSCPDRLKPLFKKLREACRELGIQSCEMQGFEADDLIATYTRKWEEVMPGKEVRIVSIDKDLAQLVSEHVTMSPPNLSTTHGIQEVRDRWGVNPDQMGDLLALWGDVADNIPGVPGIGKVKAAALLNQYSTLEGVLDAADQGLIQVSGVGHKLAENLRRSAPLARKMRSDVVQLFDLPDNLDNLEDFRPKPRDEKWLARVKEYCDKEGFKGMKVYYTKMFEAAMCAAPIQGPKVEEPRRERPKQKASKVREPVPA